MTDGTDDVLYDGNAEYYDLITVDRVAGLATVIEEFVDGLEGDEPVVDIGAGTGSITEHLAQLVDGCDVYAVEPGRGLRSILASRCAADDKLRSQITILPTTFQDAVGMLPAQLGGVISFGVLPHFSPDDRAGLFSFLAERLAPGAAALIEVMQPWTTDAVPESPMVNTTAGHHRIESTMQADPVSDDQLRWRLTYRRVDTSGEVLHETVADNVCWVVGPDAFESEARSAGLDVSWLPGDLAVLRRTSSTTTD